ncbi:MAG: hypothetical protein KKE73_01970 [Proteobacteria bacterium]|nr:hypothetical protein [Pseudomonadota bacterium]
MNKTLLRMKQEAKKLVAGQDLPGFYLACAPELSFSRTLFFDHPLIHRLREDVIPFLYDDYGHGIDHSKKVAIEGGAIVLVEMRGNDLTRARHLVLLSQMAGLLHDICRLEEDHAAKGAELCESILLDYPLDEKDKQRIAFAVADHEAFIDRKQTDDPEAALLSKALYDADKFRWGPDNFSTTLWEMCDYNDISVRELLVRFPDGLEMIKKIATTFRTSVGQTFGPQFIELGLSLGQDIFKRLVQVTAEDQG